MQQHQKPLRRGWTTGACATAASKAAFTALLAGHFPDPVTITLPRGKRTSFSLGHECLESGRATAGIVKDAGDDPDVTHGVLVLASVIFGKAKTGVIFKAGAGVGTVTKPGLPLAVGEPAINPSPRQMMISAISEVASVYGVKTDIEIEISVPGGEKIAAKTWNPRLGIVGGLSILGTTGVVVPFSCAAWIHSIHRGIDVAQAARIEHIAACTGTTSEAAVRRRYNFPLSSMIDMGDFVGGMLKYLKNHPLPKLTIGGGFAKLAKLAQGRLDLHSSRSQVDFNWLADLAISIGGSENMGKEMRAANSAMQILEITKRNNVPLADAVALKARETALSVLAGSPICIEVLIFDRNGELIGISHGW